MKEIGKIFAYLLATVVLAALIAPWLFWGGHWLAGMGIGEFLAETPFQRYFNRAALVAAVVLLWPAIRWLGVGGIRDATMRSDPARWRNLGFGLAVAVGLMAVLGTILVAADYYKMKDEVPWRKLAKVPLTAAGASVAEELMFRGAILALALRCGSRWIALFFTSALYSIVHFIKSPDDAVPQTAVTWLSGFAVLPESFWQFRDPLLLAGGFTTLFALGWILGVAALRTRSLWLPIGIHAGMILGKFGFTKLAKRRGDPNVWVGDHLEVGLCALCLMAVLWLAVQGWLRHADARVARSGR